jgi:hypothetical protein
VNPEKLWEELTTAVRAYVDANVQLVLAQLADLLPTLAPDPTAGDSRLLSVVTPPANPIIEMIREAAGALTDVSTVRIHGWQRSEGADKGLALLLTDPTAPQRFAIVAVTPAADGDPIIDVVVKGGGSLEFDADNDPWSVKVTITAPDGWEGAFGPGMGAAPTAPTATVRLARKTPFEVGMTTGPGLRLTDVSATLTSSPTGPTGVAINLNGVEIALLPAELGKLIGVSPDEGTTKSASERPVSLRAVGDHLDGLRFADAGGLRVSLPVRLKTAALRSREVSATLSHADGELRIGLMASLTASIPGLPVRAYIDDTGFSLPVRFPPGALPQLGSTPIPEPLKAIGVAVTLPPVSGGGDMRPLDDGGYAGAIALDLGVIAVQGVGQFRPPNADRPTSSFLIMLGVIFPPPGIQLSFGFALDAVGGLVGVNHRVDATALRQLVSDGNADRILFPDNLIDRADEVIDALSSSFPPAGGRFVIAPMVRITWGARMVSLSGSLILELPAPVQALILGRLLVGIPDPVVPLIRLQASILGKFDPDIPMFELLVSLAGSWIVGLAVRGEIYLLVRGGDDPEFVLSAGGFHPRYLRPAGVPALQRLQLDLCPGAGYGMRIEAYLALTSNAVQFGGQLHLEAMLADCGVEGWLGLDALFRFEPTFSFEVAMRAGVAVRAFGHRLASVGLAFTLSGPAPWRAVGVGSISVLFWDVCMDFDIGWGSPPAVSAAVADDRLPADLRAAIRTTKAWVAERPAAERTGLTFSREASDAMAAGRLLHPDAAIRVTQSVLPLGVFFNRYGRQRISAQRWIVTSVTIGEITFRPRADGEPAERFVRGEFFDLTEDEQLTAPGVAVYTSGTRISTKGFELGAGHRVDDGYETHYLEPPASGDTDFRDWPGRYDEELGFTYLAAERLDRWRSVAAPSRVIVRPPSLRLARPPLDVQALRPLDATVHVEVEAPDETSPPVDTWLLMHEQLSGVASDGHFLESWELTP